MAPWACLHDMGFKMLLAEFAPEYAGSTPSKSTLDKILSDIYSEVKEEVVQILTSVSEEYRKIGTTVAFAACSSI